MVLDKMDADQGGRSKILMSTRAGEPTSGVPILASGKINWPKKTTYRFEIGADNFATKCVHVLGDSVDLPPKSIKNTAFVCVYVYAQHSSHEDSER